MNKTLWLLSIVIVAFVGYRGGKTDLKFSPLSKTTIQQNNLLPNPANMKGFGTNIEQATLANNSFRKVLYTTNHSQLVLMSLLPKEEIGMEVHTGNDQFFRFEEGQGKCIVNGNEYVVSSGMAVIVPAGSQHNVINTSDTEKLKFYTIYSPADHKDGIEHVTKQDALANDLPFDGTTTE